MNDILSCRLTQMEADLFRLAAERRGCAVSHVIRDLVNREIRETLEVGAATRSVSA